MLFFTKLCDLGMNAAFLMAASIILCTIIPYLLGSLNFGIILSEKLYHDDVRNKGSGNAGSTNMLRSYGKKAAVMTLVGDAIKTALSCGFGLLIFGIPGMYISGLFCIVGHMYPLYYKFRGGKGIVCLAVTVLCTDWRVFLILFSVFLILVVGTKYVSLGSIIGAMMYPIVLNRLNNTGIHSIELIAVLIAALIVFQHRENFKRLLNGTENKLKFGKSKQSRTDGADAAACGSDGAATCSSKDEADTETATQTETAVPEPRTGKPDKNTSKKKIKRNK